jgi:hypothetical protein
VKTTAKQRDAWRINPDGDEAWQSIVKARAALLDDLDELRECLLLARPYVPELLNGKPLGVYARCTAALREAKEPT